MATSEIIEVNEEEKFWIPKENVAERLENGDMMCLDVGCGNGFHAARLAQAYPKSNFTGIDVTLDAVHQANQRRKDNGETFDNLAFIQMNAGSMDADWTVQVTDVCLKEIHRVLKPGGVFGMLEIKGTSNVYTDRKEMGPPAAYMYACSMFHCLPVGSNSPDALGLGTMWGEKTAVKLLKEAGFTDINVVPTPQFAVNVLYVCKKN
ncbi:methyltransferase domain protein [Ostertagia ostertagi]